MADRFHGAIPAMVTPFDSDFQLDEDRIRELIEGYLAAGVHGISVAGSQGEFFMLKNEERLRLIEIAVATVNKRVPVYAGTGAVTTSETIELTNAAESLGADIALLITPYFIQPNDEELFEHYGAVSAETKLPLLLYNNPPRTSVNISVPLFARCATLDNIAGIKDSSGDLTQFAEYMRTTGGNKLGFSGRDTLTLTMMMHGCDGAISPAANVFPELVVKQYESAREGNWDAAREAHDILAPLRAAWALGSFPVVIKEAMSIVGRDAGPTRPPIAELSPAARAQLTDVLDGIRAKIEEGTAST
jgi:4-hydroxy-tetrahydrodipicolinate synthase